MFGYAPLKFEFEESADYNQICRTDQQNNKWRDVLNIVLKNKITNKYSLRNIVHQRQKNDSFENVMKSFTFGKKLKKQGNEYVYEQQDTPQQLNIKGKVKSLTYIVRSSKRRNGMKKGKHEQTINDFLTRNGLLTNKETINIAPQNKSKSRNLAPLLLSRTTAST